ncbi:MAG: tetraacyldisaccharide 4'-kinase, partial [Candidatus Omnitrophota bacterium]
MTKIKNWYICFLEKERKNILELLFYCFLYLLSLLYGLGIYLRNFLYDKKIIKQFSSPKAVLSIGNICWSGTGKTTLALYLYKKLAIGHKVAVLRRGYGTDEESMFKEEGVEVLTSANRIQLIKNHASSFDTFILDDGFQYRKLKRDLNIVIMGARELRRKARLIPAYFFRESFASLKRADILILNYKDELEAPMKAKKRFEKIFPYLSVYLSSYRVRRFADIGGSEIPVEFLRERRLAALAAIGYPGGFFRKLRELNLRIEKEIIYPDHHQFRRSEFHALEEALLRDGIRDVV